LKGEPFPFNKTRLTRNLTVRFTPEDDRTFAEMRQDATPNQLELARTFQRLAFSWPNNHGDKYDGEFEPAPIYLRQAVACGREPHLYLQLIINLQKG
jgi:hypothetical protein